MTHRPPDTIPARLLARIYDHARRTYPEECCGYVLGRGETAEVVPCTNRQDALHAADPETYPRTARDGYQIAGKELLTLVRSFDTDRPATVIYHSHPDVGAYFSEEDTAAALSAGYPVDYLVVDVTKDRVRGAALFVRRGEAFVEVRRFPGEEDLPPAPKAEPGPPASAGP